MAYVDQIQLQNAKEVVHQWRSDALEFLRSDAPKILVVLIVAFVLIQLLKVATNRLRALSKRQPRITGARAQQLATLSGVVYGVGVFVIVFIAAMQVLPILGINMGPLLASAGVAGLAIGFGAQTLVHDVINGFFILFENHYDVGDTVKISGVQGVVENMTLRRTVLRDADGSVHIVPNSEIHVVSNLTRDWTQVALHISVAYNENSDRVVKALREIATEIWNDEQFRDMLVGEPQVPGIEKVGGNEVDYLMLVKTRPGQQFAVSRELRRRIKECFEKNHIQPPGPAQMYVVGVSGVPGQPQ